MTIAQKLEYKAHQAGRVEGVQEMALKIASSMLANGYDRTEVMKLTGLSDKELAQICH